MNVHAKKQRKRIRELEWGLYEVCELARVRSFGSNFGEIAYKVLTPDRYNSIKKIKQQRIEQAEKKRFDK